MQVSTMPLKSNSEVLTIVDETFPWYFSNEFSYLENVLFPCSFTILELLGNY